MNQSTKNILKAMAVYPLQENLTRNIDEKLMDTATKTLIDAVINVSKRIV